MVNKDAKHGKRYLHIACPTSRLGESFKRGLLSILSTTVLKNPLNVLIPLEKSHTQQSIGIKLHDARAL